MLYYALVFFLLAIFAAVLGFAGVAVAFAGIAKILFVLFLVLFLVSLVMHLGDIKNGSSVCSTEYFEQIRNDFDGFEDPFVYTPGDNEWTDCHRANNGAY